MCNFATQVIRYDGLLNYGLLGASPSLRPSLSKGVYLGIGDCFIFLK